MSQAEPAGAGGTARVSGRTRVSASRAPAGLPVDVSVLTPVLDEEAHIRALVASMQAQRFPGKVEFLFVDGGSRDRTRAILDELRPGEPRIRVLDNPAGDTASALNIALRHARGEFVARMDAHAEYPPTYLARSIERLRRGDVAWVSGPQVPVGRGRWSGRVALALESRLATGGSNRWASDVAMCDEPELELETGVFTGVWRRETLEALGGWDEGWPINQDSELAARVRRRGGRIVCLPELAARYSPRDSLGGLAHQYWRYGLYREKTARHHPESLRLVHLAMPGLALAAVAALLAPPAPARLARTVLCGYVAGVVAASARRTDDPREALALAAVFATMHGAWGAGYLAGGVRFGPPLRGLAIATGLPTAQEPPVALEPETERPIEHVRVEREAVDRGAAQQAATVA